MRSRVTGVSGQGQSNRQSVFKTCLVLTSNMNLQVLPLRVLVSRQVIRDRMDYTGYLAGKTKSEMDILDGLAGRFVVQFAGFEFNVERYFGGEKVPDDEWHKMNEWEMMPSTVWNFLDGAFASVLDKTTEISIAETYAETPRSGARTWVVSDVHGLKKPFNLTSGGWMHGPHLWVQADYFIEDGKLINRNKVFVTKRPRDGPRWTEVDQGLVMDYQDSFSLDNKGNLVREFICSIPVPDIKITIVMSALRVVSSKTDTDTNLSYFKHLPYF